MENKAKGKYLKKYICQPFMSYVKKPTLKFYEFVANISHASTKSIALSTII